MSVDLPFTTFSFPSGDGRALSLRYGPGAHDRGVQQEQRLAFRRSAHTALRRPCAGTGPAPLVSLVILVTRLPLTLRARYRLVPRLTRSTRFARRKERREVSKRNG